MKTLFTIIRKYNYSNGTSKETHKTKLLEDKELFLDSDGILGVGETKIAIYNIDEITVNKEDFSGPERMRKDLSATLTSDDNMEKYRFIKNFVLESFIKNDCLEIVLEEYHDVKALYNAFGGVMKKNDEEISYKIFLNLKNWCEDNNI